MCGIYGYIGSPENIKKYHEKVLDMFINLGLETEIRGKHATGFYGVTTDSIIMQKTPGKASNFYLDSEVYKSLNDNLPNIIIGHNRHATHGSPDDNNNNHPFYTNRFGFIHNGVVGYSTNPHKLNIKPESECDSEWIFRYFIKHFYDSKSHFATIRKTMKAFEDGDFACAMIDAKDRKLLLWRNIGRPISIYFSKEHNILFFSSTKEIMRSAAKLSKIDIIEENMHYLKEGRIMSISENLEIKKDLVVYESKVIETTSAYSLPKKHKKIITSTSKSNYCECPIKGCDRKFLDKNYLNLHLQSVHGMHIDDNGDVKKNTVKGVIKTSDILKKEVIETYEKFYTEDNKERREFYAEKIDKLFEEIEDRFGKIFVEKFRDELKELVLKKNEKINDTNTTQSLS